MTPAEHGGVLERIRQWFRREARSVEEVAEGETAVATPPRGADRTGDADRETSTNAQTAGASDEPWS